MKPRTCWLPSVCSVSPFLVPTAAGRGINILGETFKANLPGIQGGDGLDEVFEGAAYSGKIDLTYLSWIAVNSPTSWSCFYTVFRG